MICHISSLASVYHKPPTAFVEGRAAGTRKSLPARSNSNEDSTQHTAQPHAQVIPAQDSLIGDLLSMDIGGPTMVTPTPASQSGLGLDLLGSGLDGILGGTDTGSTAPVYLKLLLDFLVTYLVLIKDLLLILHLKLIGYLLKRVKDLIYGEHSQEKMDKLVWI